MLWVVWPQMIFCCLSYLLIDTKIWFTFDLLVWFWWVKKKKRADPWAGSNCSLQQRPWSNPDTNQGLCFYYIKIFIFISSAASYFQNGSENKLPGFVVFFFQPIRMGRKIACSSGHFFHPFVKGWIFWLFVALPKSRSRHVFSGAGRGVK